MKLRNTAKTVLLLSAIAAFFATTTRALPEFMKLYASDPFSRSELRTHCSNCHVNPAGSGPRNEFGQAFEAAGKKITPELRQQFPALFRPGGESQDQTAAPPPVTFVPGSQSEAIVEINGKKYRINTTGTNRDPSRGHLAGYSPARDNGDGYGDFGGYNTTTR